jgi:hypothetical protein
MNDFENRFIFIKDDILRQNLAQGFQHVTELVLLTKLNHPISINKSFLGKSIIVWSAAIVESMMFHLLQEKKLWENFSEKWQPSNPNRIHITPEGEEFI